MHASSYNVRSTIFQAGVMILFVVILSRFVSKQVMNVALDGKLIDETEVECRPERIPDSVVGENVDISLVCSTDAWKLVETVLENKAKRIIYICTWQSCNHDLHSEQSIICNACLR